MNKQAQKLFSMLVLVFVLGTGTAYAMPGDASIPPFNPGNKAQPIQEIHIGGAPLSSGFDAGGALANALTHVDKPNSIFAIFGRLYVGGSTRLGNIGNFIIEDPFSFSNITLPTKAINLAGTFLSTTFAHSGTPAQKTLCVQNQELMLCENTVIPVGYSCTGTTPSNASLCSGDDINLLADTAKTVVASCGDPKCEYTCNPGYVYSAGSCVPANFVCTGATPPNSSLCSGDSTGLLADTPKTTVTVCTSDTKCEYQQLQEPVNFVTTAEILSSSDTHVEVGTNPVTGDNVTGDMCNTYMELTNSVYFPLGITASSGNFVYQQMYQDIGRTTAFTNTGYVRFISATSPNNATIFKVVNGIPTTNTILCP